MNVVTAGSPSWHLPAHPTAAAARGRQWRWLAAGLALAFAIPFVLTDLVSIDRDLYYGIYIGGVFGFFGAWLRYATQSPRALLTRNWRSRRRPRPRSSSAPWSRSSSTSRRPPHPAASLSPPRSPGAACSTGLRTA